MIGVFGKLVKFVQNFFAILPFEFRILEIEFFDFKDNDSVLACLENLFI